MSQKVEKPSLSGQRLKTRKRDEKEKYDPIAFRDAILQGFTEAGDSLEQISKFLDTAGSRLNYRRYGEPLLDVLFAGGILAPGGSIVQDNDPEKPYHTKLCIFGADNNIASVKEYYDVLYKLIRRYKYIEKQFQEELLKLIAFLKGFGVEERQKLAIVVGICLANGLGNPSCLSALYEEHLVKEGLSLDFATVMFDAWLKEKDIQNVANALKRAGLEGRLSDLLPMNKRTFDNFEKHFNAAGLTLIVDYQRLKANVEVKKELNRKLEEMIGDEAPVKEIIPVVMEQMERNGMTEHELVTMAWNTIMSAVEWNKKDELVAEQALKHLKAYAPLLSALTTKGRSELVLLCKIQEYCYENMNFLTAFQKIIVLLYKLEVLGEDVIQHWYKEGHSTKGKSVFLGQMKNFVEWLEDAEEESEEED